jgi:hypothetical protein
MMPILLKMGYGMLALYICTLSIHQSKASSVHSSGTFLPVLNSDSAATAALASEFEGRYQVGEAICIVVPVKMAFEVTWLKKQERMYFYFKKTTSDGKSIFVSKNLRNGRNRFIFDDASYNSGKFITIDGNIFSVKRLVDVP